MGKNIETKEYDIKKQSQENIEIIFVLVRGLTAHL